MAKVKWKAEQPENANGWWVVTDSEGNELGSTDGGFEEDQAKLMAASPELYDSNVELIGAVNALLTGRAVKNLDEIMAKAQYLGSILESSRLALD